MHNFSTKGTRALKLRVGRRCVTVGMGGSFLNSHFSKMFVLSKVGTIVENKTLSQTLLKKLSLKLMAFCLFLIFGNPLESEDFIFREGNAKK